MNHPASGYCARRHGCERPECIERGRKYAALRANLRRMGKSTMIPIEPVRARTRQLLDQGYSLSQLSKAWSCKPDTIIKMMKPSDPRTTITGSFGAKVLTTKIVGPPRGRVSSVGAQRRIRSLVRDGHQTRKITQMVREREEKPGCTAKWVGEVMQGKYAKICTERHLILVDVFEKLVLTPGDSTQARSFGRKKGWPRPLAWNPNDLDDPDVEPPEDAEVWRCSGCRRRMVTNWTYSRLSATRRRYVQAHAGYGKCPACYQRVG